VELKSLYGEEVFTCEICYDSRRNTVGTIGSTGEIPQRAFVDYHEMVQLAG